VVHGTEEGGVVVATRGEPDLASTSHNYPIRIADREVGQLRLWPQAGSDLTGWKEAIEFALQPVAIAFENTRLLQQIAHRAVRGERTRIARELHDEIGPSLASLGLSIDMAIHQFDVGPELGRHLETTRRHVTALTESVRGTAADLRRDETESVVEKAHELAADIGADGPSVTITIEERRPPRGNRATEIKAILTEAFRNALAHSGATTISIHGTVDRDRGRVTVVDNGAGFDPSVTPPGHFGLVGMKERAANIEADLDIASSAGEGTSVSIEWGGSR
jgi:signal transduction histidine kinase